MAEAQPPTQLELLLAAIDEAKQVIREAHEVTKDLHAATRAGREVFRTLLRDEWEPMVKAELQKDLAVLGEHTAEAMRRATAKVAREFDKLAKVYMRGEGKGNPSLDELMAARQTLRREQQHRAAREGRIVGKAEPPGKRR